MSTERKLLLSDEGVVRLTERDKPQMKPFEVRDFYEAKIASGELRVCKPVKAVFSEEDGREEVCNGCSFWPVPKTSNFCPGCGNPISER